MHNNIQSLATLLLSVILASCAPTIEPKAPINDSEANSATTTGSLLSQLMGNWQAYKTEGPAKLVYSEFEAALGKVSFTEFNENKSIVRTHAEGEVIYSYSSPNEAEQSGLLEKKGGNSGAITMDKYDAKGNKIANNVEFKLEGNLIKFAVAKGIAGELSQKGLLSVEIVSGELIETENYFILGNVRKYFRKIP